MKYAVMSDMHANPAAFKAALDDAERQGCGRIACLGDLTGYGYDPRTCVDVARRRAGFCLMGNHDSACAGLEPEWEVLANPNYREDVKARQKLTAGERAWLSGLPYIHAENGAAFTHGTFGHPEAWGYMISAMDARRNFGLRPERLLFCGHTHHANAWVRRPNGDVAELGLPGLDNPAETGPDAVTFRLEEGCRYLVNTGSVGYPRRDFCSVYAVWDVEAETVSFRRSPFDFIKYARELRNHGVRVPGWLCDIIEFLEAHAAE